MCGLVIEMACVYVDYVSLDIHEQHDFIIHNISEDCLHIIVFFMFFECSNHVSSIYKRLIFGVVSGWDHMGDVKIFYM
jgi:hypothetical protein